MTGPSVRWGILGPGSVARRFAEELPRSRTGRLHAVASRSLEHAKSFTDEHGAATSYGSYAELLADDAVDAVYIATVPIAHHDLAVRAAAAGKHVLVEKPLAVNHAWTMAVVEAARSSDVFLLEAYMYRHHPQTQLLRELIQEGAIGEVHSIEASCGSVVTPWPTSGRFDPALGGGGILGVGCYPVSMARLVAGAAIGLPFINPESVTAVGTVGESGVDEWSVATLGFHTGVTARVSAGVRAGDENTVKIYGSRGHILVPLPWMVPVTDPGRLVLTTAGVGRRTLESEPAYPYAVEVDVIGDRDDAREAPQMSWSDSLGNAAVLDQWRAAIELGYPFEADEAAHPALTVSNASPGSSGRRQPTMPYVSVPGLVKQLSRLVMGCDNQQTMAHASVMFDDFVERGGTTFDTGYAYGGGRMERLLGRWMANRDARDHVVVIGKGGHTPFCDPASITRQLHETLDRLGTDHVDVYLMHRDNPAIGVAEFVDVLDEHRRAGLMSTYGVSNWTIDRYTDANRYARSHGRAPLAVLSNHFGLARALHLPWPGCEHVTDRASRAWLSQQQVPLLARSSQACGFFAPYRAHPDQHTDPELVRCFYSDDNFERLRRASALARRHGVQATAIALAYVLSQPFPTFALIGPRSIEETRTSTEALRVELTRAELDWLDLTSDGEP